MNRNLRALTKATIALPLKVLLDAHDVSEEARSFGAGAEEVFAALVLSCRDTADGVGGGPTLGDEVGAEGTDDGSGKR